jgi:hypothetical protein
MDSEKTIPEEDDGDESLSVESYLLGWQTDVFDDTLSLYSLRKVG